MELAVVVARGWRRADLQPDYSVQQAARRRLAVRARSRAARFYRNGSTSPIWQSGRAAGR